MRHLANAGRCVVHRAGVDAKVTPASSTATKSAQRAPRATISSRLRPQPVHGGPWGSVTRGFQWFVQCDPYGLRRRALTLRSTLSPADLDAGLAHRPRLALHQQKLIPMLQPGQLPAAWSACSHLPAYAYVPFAELLRRQPLIRRRGRYTTGRRNRQTSGLDPGPPYRLSRRSTKAIRCSAAAFPIGQP